MSLRRERIIAGLFVMLEDCFRIQTASSAQRRRAYEGGVPSKRAIRFTATAAHLALLMAMLNGRLAVLGSMFSTLKSRRAVDPRAPLLASSWEKEKERGVNRPSRPETL